ncbi:hypothetical protein [Sagittula sp. S175]|uniref:hypothetical protein n=1 Tax=Sagittula sp. S175 TaxID=3415129 RepID=UPI003C7D362C
MITGELKSRVDAMLTGGLSNPQTVMELLTLLLFLKGLDDAQSRGGDGIDRRTGKIPSPNRLFGG